MCEATTIIAAAGLALSAAGTAYSVNQQQHAASAANAANVTAMNAQNNAFWARDQNERQRLQEEGTAQTGALAATQQAFEATRGRQAQALEARRQTTEAENADAEGIRSAADQAQQNLLDKTSGQALDAAQQQEAASRTQAFAPISENIQTASPLGNPDEGSPTKQAFAARLAEAASAVKDYGKRVAQVASYTAPLNTVSREVSNNASQLMPIAAANQLLQSGQNIRLLPSQQAYSIAGAEGQAQKSAIDTVLQGQMGVLKNRYQGQEDVIGLEQTDTTQLARNKATTAADQAKVGQSIGSLISTVGNLGAYGAERYAGILGGGSPSGDALLGAAGNGSILGKGNYASLAGPAGSFQVTR